MNNNQDDFEENWVETEVIHWGYLQEKLWSWLRGMTVLHIAVLYDTQHAGWQNKKTLQSKPIFYTELVPVEQGANLDGDLS